MCNICSFIAAVILRTAAALLHNARLNVRFRLKHLNILLNNLDLDASIVYKCYKAILQDAAIGGETLE